LTGFLLGIAGLIPPLVTGPLRSKALEYLTDKTDPKRKKKLFLVVGPQKAGKSSIASPVSDILVEANYLVLFKDRVSLQNYPLAVTQEAHQEAMENFGPWRLVIYRNLKTEYILTKNNALPRTKLRDKNLNRFWKKNKLVLKSLLKELEINLVRDLRGCIPFQNIENIIRNTSFIITTDHHDLGIDFESDLPYVAGCRMLSLNEVFLHPDFFNQPREKQFEIICHEVREHVILGLEDRERKISILELPDNYRKADLLFKFIRQGVQKGASLEEIKEATEALRSLIKQGINPRYANYKDLEETQCRISSTNKFERMIAALALSCILIPASAEILYRAILDENDPEAAKEMSNALKFLIGQNIRPRNIKVSDLDKLKAGINSDERNKCLTAIRGLSCTLLQGSVEILYARFLIEDDPEVKGVIEEAFIFLEGFDIRPRAKEMPKPISIYKATQETGVKNRNPARSFGSLLQTHWLVGIIAILATAKFFGIDLTEILYVFSSNALQVWVVMGAIAVSIAVIRLNKLWQLSVVSLSGSYPKPSTYTYPAEPVDKDHQATSEDIINCLRYIKNCLKNNALAARRSDFIFVVKTKSGKIADLETQKGKIAILKWLAARAPPFTDTKESRLFQIFIDDLLRHEISELANGSHQKAIETSAIYFKNHPSELSEFLKAVKYFGLKLDKEYLNRLLACVQARIGQSGNLKIPPAILAILNMLGTASNDIHIAFFREKGVVLLLTKGEYERLYGFYHDTSLYSGRYNASGNYERINNWFYYRYTPQGTNEARRIWSRVKLVDNYSISLPLYLKGIDVDIKDAIFTFNTPSNYLKSLLISLNIEKLREVFQSGLLYTIIPGTKNLVNEKTRYQHYFHGYTLDEHTIKGIEYLQEAPEYYKLSPKGKEIITVALLLHDISKKGGSLDERREGLIRPTPEHPYLSAIMAARILVKDLGYKPAVPENEFNLAYSNFEQKIKEVIRDRRIEIKSTHIALDTFVSEIGRDSDIAYIIKLIFFHDALANLAFFNEGAFGKKIWYEDLIPYLASEGELLLLKIMAEADIKATRPGLYTEEKMRGIKIVYNKLLSGLKKKNRLPDKLQFSPIALLAGVGLLGGLTGSIILGLLGILGLIVAIILVKSRLIKDTFRTASGTVLNSKRKCPLTAPSGGAGLGVVSVFIATGLAWLAVSVLGRETADIANAALAWLQGLFHAPPGEIKGIVLTILPAKQHIFEYAQLLPLIAVSRTVRKNNAKIVLKALHSKVIEIGFLNSEYFYNREGFKEITRKVWCGLGVEYHGSFDDIFELFVKWVNRHKLLDSENSWIPEAKNLSCQGIELDLLSVARWQSARCIGEFYFDDGGVEARGRPKSDRVLIFWDLEKNFCIILDDAFCQIEGRIYNLKGMIFRVHRGILAETNAFEMLRYSDFIDVLKREYFKEFHRRFSISEVISILGLERGQGGHRYHAIFTRVHSFYNNAEVRQLEWFGFRHWNEYYQAVQLLVRHKNIFDFGDDPFVLIRALHRSLSAIERAFPGDRKFYTHRVIQRINLLLSQARVKTLKDALVLLKRIEKNADKNLSEILKEIPSRRAFDFGWLRFLASKSSSGRAFIGMVILTLGWFILYLSGHQDGHLAQAGIYGVGSLFTGLYFFPKIIKWLLGRPFKTPSPPLTPEQDEQINAVYKYLIAPHIEGLMGDGDVHEFIAGSVREFGKEKVLLDHKEWDEKGLTDEKSLAKK
ncbi:hypothetical protein D4R78_08450, partial [bacterium]